MLGQGLNTVSEVRHALILNLIRLFQLQFSFLFLQVPESRFDVSAYNNGAHGAARLLKTKFGNFIDDPDVLDNVFFRMSPREARSMDPQQRLLLHVAYHALENAGYVPVATAPFEGTLDVQNKLHRN